MTTLEMNDIKEEEKNYCEDCEHVHKFWFKNLRSLYCSHIDNRRMKAEWDRKPCKKDRYPACFSIRTGSDCKLYEEKISFLKLLFQCWCRDG